MEQIPLALLMALQTMGISVVLESPSCLKQPLYMGEFVPKEEILTLCPKNAAAQGIPIDRIVRHEMVHAIHQRFRLGNTALTPEPLFTELVRKNVPSEEVMAVFGIYDKENFDQEIEARLLERVMTNEQLATLAVASQVFFKVTTF
jgi:hypothetical protein